MKSIMYKLKQFLIFEILAFLSHNLCNLKEGNAVTFHTYSYILLLGAHCNGSNFRSPFLRSFPSFQHFPSILVFEIFLTLLFLDPQCKVPKVWTDKKSFSEWAYLCYWNLCLLVKDVIKISFDFVVISDRTNHEYFTTVSSCKYLCFVKPGMCSVISVFWKLFYLLRRLKRIIFNLVKFEKSLPTHRYYMRLSGTNC